MMNHLFDAAGWALKEDILEHSLVAYARSYLEMRLVELSCLYAQGKLGEPALTHFLRGEFDLDTRLSPVVTDILSSLKCRFAVSQFLQADQYYVHYPLMVRFKLPDTSANEVPAHQDDHYTTHLTGGFVTIWAPLVDIDEGVGGLIVHEGSQFSDFEYETHAVWGEGIITTAFVKKHVLMNAGDALFFPPHLVHQSAAQLSTRIRYSIDFRVFLDPKDTTRSYYDPYTKEVTRLD